jgi:hypothetical protein
VQNGCKYELLLKKFYFIGASKLPDCSIPVCGIDFLNSKAFVYKGFGVFFFSQKEVQPYLMRVAPFLL